MKFGLIIGIAIVAVVYSCFVAASDEDDKNGND